MTLFSASSATIAGHLVAAGEMPRFAQVFLIPTESLSRSHAGSKRWVMTEGNDTAFEFKHVEPGKYILGFEIGHSATLNVPYDSRYYPEGNEAARATEIEVHSGERIANIEFGVGNEVKRRHVRVRVTWSDGSPAENATAYLRDAHNPYSSVADEQTPTNAKGEAVLEGFINTDYDVDANAVCKGRSSSNSIEKKIIPASSEDAFVTLTVKGRKCSLVNWQLEIEDE
ncbi:MAG TPA: hypothetical protein VEI54_12210 [Candidatus Limnocylindrales bacterium]|nr:hypothetical protein [Candidatus Limnocylindrales bacterium]